MVVYVQCDFLADFKGFALGFEVGLSPSTIFWHLSFLLNCNFALNLLCAFQELHSSVSDIVEGILTMHDNTKVRGN